MGNGTDGIPERPGSGADVDWRVHGVQVIPGDALDTNTAQTPGMHRAAAVNHARAGAERLWAGTVQIHPGARTGPHHHGELESVIYVLRGRARMRWGPALEYTAEGGPGSFIFVPPFVPHQEINALDDEPLECVVVRSGQEPIVVNLDIEGVAEPQRMPWVDPAHPADRRTDQRPDRRADPAPDRRPPDPRNSVGTPAIPGPTCGQPHRRGDRD